MGKLRIAVVVSFLLGLFLVSPLAQIKIDSQYFINLAGTAAGPVKFVDGTTSAPGATFGSETGLGFTRPGAGYIAFVELTNMDWASGGGNFIVTSGGAVGFSSTTNPYSGSFDTRLVRDAANTLAQKNSTNNQLFRVYDATGTGFTELSGAAGFSKYKNVTTTGWGVPAIVGAGRQVAQSGAVGSVATYTVGAADGSFEVSDNFNATTATSFTVTVTCAYTDESNVVRTITFQHEHGGSLVATITNATGAGPYHGIPLHIRAKAATAITIATTGTFTTVTYNVEGSIRQIS